MIKLDAATKSIEVDLDVAITTSQLPIYATYSDVSQTTFALSGAASADTQTNSTTAVTAVSAPSASTTRKVDLITVYNADTVDADVTVQLNNNSTIRVLVKQKLEPGETLQYADGEGWSVPKKKDVLPITSSDTLAFDAFGMLRTSQPGNRLDVEFIYDKQLEYFDEVTNGASATVTHNANTRDLTLTVGSTTNGEYSEMSSFPVPYTPGSSHLTELTGVFDFADIGSGTAQYFLRTSISGSVSETVVDQSSWDSNTSGIDWADSHIAFVDFQSLKVGRLRYGFNRAGVAEQIGQIVNDNVRNSGYWQQANLPAYYRIYNDSTYTYMEMGYGNTDNGCGIRYRITANATATMKAICCTVKSEGGEPLRSLPGLPRTANTGVTTRTISTTTYPVISIRSKSTFQGFDNLMLSIPKSATLQSDEAILVTVIIGGTLTGASWTDVDTNNSCMEYDVSATAITGGRVVRSRYFYATSTGPASSQVTVAGDDPLGKSVLWDRQSSETGILTLAMIRTGSSDATVLAGIDWEEIR